MKICERRTQEKRSVYVTFQASTLGVPNRSRDLSMVRNSDLCSSILYRSELCSHDQLMFRSLSLYIHDVLVLALLDLFSFRSENMRSNVTGQSSTLTTAANVVVV